MAKVMIRVYSRPPFGRGSGTIRAEPPLRSSVGPSDLARSQ